MKHLETRLSTPSVGKDDEALYGELLASNLRKLDKDNQLLAKHDIDNVIFRYLYAQRQQEKTVQRVAEPVTPTHGPTHAYQQHSLQNLHCSPMQPPQNVADGSPVYGPSYSDLNLMQESNPYAVRANLFGQYRMGNTQ